MALKYKEPITYRDNKVIKAKMEKAAEKEGLSLAQWMRRLTRDKLKKVDK